MSLANDLLARLVDVHCHPHDEPHYDEVIAGQTSIQVSHQHLLICDALQLCCMSSNLYNQDTTKRLAQVHPNHIIPAYGLHPWFCHPVTFEHPPPTKVEHYTKLFSAAAPQDLTSDILDAMPDLIHIDDLLSILKATLESHPAAMLGEVGLDKTFRIASGGNHIAPHSMTTSTTLTSLKTPIAHQVRVLEAQMKLAVDLHRAMSVHCVAAQGPLFDLIGRLGSEEHKGDAFRDVSVDLHAYGGSAESVQQLQKHHPNIYFSFSSTINARSKKLHQVIQAVNEHRLLAESDWPKLDEQPQRLGEIVQVYAEARGWSTEQTVDILERNWYKFKHQKELAGTSAPA